MTDAWMPAAERLSAAADGGCLKGGAPRVVWLVLHADPMTVSARAAAEHLIELGRPSHLVWNPLSGDVAQLIPAVRAGRALGWDGGPHWGPRPAGLGWGGGPGVGQPGWGAGGGWAEAPDHVPGSGAGRQRAGDSDWHQQNRWTSGHGWAQEPDWDEDPDWTLNSASTHGADWTPGAGWTHRCGRRQLATVAARPPGEPIAPAARDGLAGVNTEGRACVQIGVVGHAWAPFTDGPLARVREIVSWLDSWHVAAAGPPDARHPSRARSSPGSSAAGTGLMAVTSAHPRYPVAGRPGRGHRHRTADRPPAVSAAAGARGPGSPARIPAMTWQPRLTLARSAAP